MARARRQSARRTPAGRNAARGDHRVELANRQRGYRPDRRRLIELARRLLAAEGCPAADVEIAVVDDPQIARLNAEYLRHRGPTDVISFDLSDSPDRLVAQIVVSADTARRQAGRLGHPIAAELALYVVHGLLHVLGYDDLSEPARTRMHARQAELMRQFGYCLRQ